MTIGIGSLIEIAPQMVFLGQQVVNVWQYEVVNISVGSTPVAVAEAWWNHVKGTMRALSSTGFGAVFKTVKLRELNNPIGDYAEFDIPIGEQTGTRTPPTQGTGMPPMVGAGVRLVVGTRATRPGQKRFAFLTEQDNDNGVLQSSFVSLVQAHMAVMTVPLVLGAPAATSRLDPIVVRKDVAGNVTASQLITGYLINSNISTQNSRKYGRGS